MRIVHIPPIHFELFLFFSLLPHVLDHHDADAERVEEQDDDNVDDGVALGDFFR